MRSVLAKTDYCQLDYELDQHGRIYLHLDLREFSLSVARRMKSDFREVLEHLAEKGYREVFVLIPSEDTRLARFERWFGFTELTQIGPYTVYRQEIEHGY